MSHRLPLLKGLRAFEVAARHESFASAAKELGLTPSAVSQQVKALESDLGIGLFERQAKGLRLTDLGKTYASSLTKAFRLITEATERVSPLLPGRKLRVGVGKDVRITLSKNWPNDQPPLERHVILASNSSAPRQISAGRVDAVLAFAPTSEPGQSVEAIAGRSQRAAGKPVFFVCASGILDCHQSQALRAWLRDS